jgi:Domain of unknown function (DUF4142)
VRAPSIRRHPRTKPSLRSLIRPIAGCAALHTGSKGSADKVFIVNRCAIDAAKIAQLRAHARGVQGFARKMIPDHARAQMELKSALQQAKAQMTLPRRLDARHAKPIDTLRKASANVLRTPPSQAGAGASAGDHDGAGLGEGWRPSAARDVRVRHPAGPQDASADGARAAENRDARGPRRATRPGSVRPIATRRPATRRARQDGGTLRKQPNVKTVPSQMTNA